MTTILIVEDSFQDRKLYSEAMSSLFQVELLYAESAEEALKLMKIHKIDLFLLDVELPGMDGFSLAARIRNTAQYELTLILFITGYSKNPLEAFRQYHCYDFIVKPFSIEEFKEKIAGLIEKLHRKKERESPIIRKLVAFETEGETIFVPIEEILFAQVSRSRCEVQTKTHLISLKKVALQDVIETVNDTFFVRCHKSFAVNVKQIASIRRINYRLSELSFEHSERKIDMSKLYQGNVEELLSELNQVEGKKQEKSNELV